MTYIVEKQRCRERQMLFCINVSIISINLNSDVNDKKKYSKLFGSMTIDK